MKTARRAIRTLIRSPLRSALVLAVLTVSIGLALIMITVNQAFAKRLDDIKSQAGTSITVRAAGTFGGGFFGGGGGGGASDPGTTGGTTGGGTTTGDAAQTTTPSLTGDDITKVLALANVVSASSQITVRYTGTELTAAQPVTTGTGGTGGGGRGGFQRAIVITGTDDPTNLTSLGSTDVTIASGRTFSASETNADVAVMGATLAQANNLAAGDTFQLQGTTFQLVGTYSTGTQFGDNSVFIPLKTAQTLFQRPGEVDTATVYADSVDDVNTVADGIRTTLGASTVDVTTQLAVFQSISSPLSDAKNSSQIGMFVALAASAAIILFSIGLVARQRIKEIGILKAVGASGWHVTGQFAIETAVISIFAALVGALATFPLAQTVANDLVSTPSTPTFGGGPGGGGRGAAFAAARGGRAAAGFFGGTGSGLLGNVGVAVSPDIFVYALAIAVGLAVLATVVPAWYVGRVKPAAVLRHE